MSGIKGNLARAGACLLSGGLLALSGSLHPVWAAAWVASVPVLVAAFRSRLWTGFGLAFAASLIGSIPLILYVRAVMPLPVLTMVMGMIALGYAIGVVLAAAARRRLPAWIAVFAFPAWTAGLDTLNAATSPHGVAGSLAFSQMDFTPVLQVASLGGGPAVVFLVVLFASGLAFAITDLKAARGGVIAAAAVVLAGLGFGVLRLSTAPAEPTETVAIAALDQKRQMPTDWRATLQTYAPRLAEARDKGARLLVLPEEISMIPAADVAEMSAGLRSWSRASGATLAVGFRVMEQPRPKNRLFVFAPDGRVMTYDKRHLIAGLETAEVAAGTGPVFAAEVGGLKLGGAICKDYDFIDTSRALAADGAKLIAAPAWDFDEDAWLHGRMAVLDGVEGGFTLVRSARRGAMTVSDRYGRVLAEARSGPDAPLLVAQAPVPTEPAPLYARIGDVFGWACGAAALLLLGGVLLARRP